MLEIKINDNYISIKSGKTSVTRLMTEKERSLFGQYLIEIFALEREFKLLKGKSNATNN